MSHGATVSYDARDSILYALSVGFGSQVETYEEDLPFLNENDPRFEVFPTFLFSLIFWASKKSTGRLPDFPPPFMKAMGVIPRSYLKNETTIGDFPVIHTWQSLEIHSKIPNPRSRSCGPFQLTGNFSGVETKSVGTFVGTETAVRLGHALIATIRSKTLLMGLTSDHLNISNIQPPKRDPSRYRGIQTDGRTQFQWRCVVPTNAPLLYRMASGDSNVMHVDPSAVPPELRNNTPGQPLLHGLCTLGIAARALLSFAKDLLAAPRLTYLEGQFSHPVFPGDRLVVQAWRVEGPGSIIAFKVLQEDTSVAVLKNGYAEFQVDTTSRL